MAGVVSTRRALALLIVLMSTTRLASSVVERMQSSHQLSQPGSGARKSSGDRHMLQSIVSGIPKLRGGAPPSPKPTVCKFEFEIENLQEHEVVAVVGSLEQLGAWDLSKAIPLLRIDNNLWGISLVLPRDMMISYKYIIKRDIKWEELDTNRAFIAPRSSGPVVVRELYNSPSPRMLDMNNRNVRHGFCRFQVKVDGLSGNDYMAVIGSHYMLGKWDVEEAIPLHHLNAGDSTIWTGDVELASEEPSDYKYVILRQNEWEPLNGDRSFYTSLDGKLTSVNDQFGVMSSKPLTPPKGVARKGVAALCNFELKLPGLSDTDGVAIVGNQDWLGSWEVARAVPMDRVNSDTFSITVHLPAGELIQYKYVILHQPQWEGLHIHRSVVVASGGLTLTTDAFDEPFHPMGVRCPPLLASAPSTNTEQQAGPTTVRFEVTSKFLEPDDHVGILGSHELLGAWDETRARPMEREGGDPQSGDTRWVSTMELTAGQQIDYKYVVLPSVRWEPLESNREMSTASATFAPMRQRDRSGVITPIPEQRAMPMASPVRPPSGKRSASPPSLEDLEEGHAQLHPHPQNRPPPPLPSPFSSGQGAAMDSGKKRCSFRVEVEGKLGKSDRVLLCGSDPSVGAWEIARAMHLLPSPGEVGVWVGSVAVEPGKVMYKYLVERRGSEGGAPVWENGGDRVVDAQAGGKDGVMTVSDKMTSPLPPPADEQEPPHQQLAHSPSSSQMSPERSCTPQRAAPGQVVTVAPSESGLLEGEEWEDDDEGLMEGEFAWVEEVMHGSPAAEAGLKAGDRLLEIGPVTHKEVEENGLSAVNAAVLGAAESKSALMVKIVRMEDFVGGHGSWRVVRLTPKKWQGEGLIGMRLARSH